MPALHSCAQSQNLMPASGNRSEIGIIAEPMIPKACSMPCICSTVIKASSVVIFICLLLQYSICVDSNAVDSAAAESRSMQMRPDSFSNRETAVILLSRRDQG